MNHSPRSARALALLSMALCALGACGSDDDDPESGDCGGVLAGDLVITEVLANPKGEDRGNEWFEVYNASSTSFDMTGVTLVYTLLDGTGRKAHEMGHLVVEAGDYVVLGGVVEELKPSYVDYGYGSGLSAMRNGGARLALECGGTIIDEMEYPDVSASNLDGYSFGLDGNQAPSHLSNDDPNNLCPATVEFTADNFGSPGESNEPCNIAVPGMCNDGGSMRATVSPQVGDLVITELMSQAGAVTDNVGEWFEVYAARDVDLNGLVYGKDVGTPKNSVAATECVRVPAGEYLVFARGADNNCDDDDPEMPTCDGGLPVVDFVFDKIELKNSFGTGPGTLYIGLGETVLDLVTYEVSKDGTSLALDPRVLSPEGNDNPANWCDGTTGYGLGDLGTPGAVNEECATEPTECDSTQCTDGEACRAIVPPTAGQIRITEIMANPEGTESVREWFELTAMASFDLNGLDFYDRGTLLDTKTFSPPQCVPVESGQIVVFARSLSSDNNDNLPQADHLQTFGLVNTDGSLGIGHGGVVLDTFAYGSITSANEGRSQQIDPDGTPPFCFTPVTSPYGAGTICGTAGGDGNCGTPGMANPNCE